MQTTMNQQPGFFCSLSLNSADQYLHSIENPWTNDELQDKEEMDEEP